MAFDANSPAQTHNALSDIAQIRENFNQLRKFEASASEPGNPVAGMLWYHTDHNSIYQRNAANNAWIALWILTNPPLMQPSSSATGDLLLGRSTNIWVRLAAGTAGYLLRANGAGADPSWAAPPAPGAATVGQSALKTAYGEVYFSTNQNSYGANYTLPGGEHGFYPRVKCWNDPANTSHLEAKIATAFTAESYLTNIYLFSTRDSGTGFYGAYSCQRYVTASGKDFWIFLLVKKDSGEILRGMAAPDHPCFGNGDDPEAVPHPFSDYLGKPLPGGEEIVVVDMASTKALLKQIGDSGRGGVFEEIRKKKLTVDMTKEIGWKPRDMDGQRSLKVKHPSWSCRRLKGL